MQNRWLLFALLMIPSCGTPVGIDVVNSDIFVEVGGSTAIEVVSVSDLGNPTAYEGELTITSSDETVAEVAGRTVRGLQIGTAELDITDDTFSTSANVTVVATGTLPTQLVITPASITCTTDSEDTPLQVFGVFSNGSSEDITDLVSFESSNNNIALITSDGAVVCVNVGTAAISVSYLGLSGSVVTTVETAPPTSIDFLPPALTCVPGIIQPIQVTATDANGSTSDVTLSATYVSGNPSVALAIDGEITCFEEGQTLVTAEVQGVTGSMVVNVEPPPPSPIDEAELSVTPSIIDCTAARVVPLTVTVTFPDGTTVDLTNSPETRYESSDVAVAQASQGQVLCVQVGAARVQISAGEFSTEVLVNVR
ncbi:MAG: hypothetical protein ACYTHJ_06725 [Planctomycetota bacterium]|jgi:hypothetical protein